MEECYHGPCDIYNHTDKNKNNISWDFLVKTTQTLIGEYLKLFIDRTTNNVPILQIQSRI